jgi:hypothetical protein
MAVSRKSKQASATGKKPKQSNRVVTSKKPKKIAEIYFKSIFENTGVNVLPILHFKDC